MTKEWLQSALRRYRWLSPFGVAAAVAVLLLFFHPVAQAQTAQPPAGQWAQPSGSKTVAPTTAPASNSPPAGKYGGLVPVPSPKSSAPVPRTSPATTATSSAPAAITTDPAQTAVMKALKGTWQDIVTHAPSHSRLTKQQKTLPPVAFVHTVTCEHWKYDKMPTAIGKVIRFCPTMGSIQVVTKEFNALGQNDPDAQTRGIAAAFIQYASIHLGPGQKTYSDGSDRKYNDVLGALQYIVTTSLGNAYGMGEESTYVVIQPGEAPDSGSIQGYYNLDSDQGPWA